jgi:hypothetical protein
MEFGSSYVLENTRMSTADRCSERLVRDDVNYSEYAYLLYKLVREIVKHLKSYLPNEDDVRNVLQYHQTPETFQKPRRERGCNLLILRSRNQCCARSEITCFSNALRLGKRRSITR